MADGRTRLVDLAAAVASRQVGGWSGPRAAVTDRTSFRGYPGARFLFARTVSTVRTHTNVHAVYATHTDGRNCDAVIVIVLCAAAAPAYPHRYGCSGGRTTKTTTTGHHGSCVLISSAVTVRYCTRSFASVPVNFFFHVLVVVFVSVAVPVAAAAAAAAADVNRTVAQCISTIQSHARARVRYLKNH